MPLSQEEIAHALELFEGAGPLTTRRMFGGLGIYAQGVIFAVVMSDGTIRLKGQGEMVQTFKDMGMSQWTYHRPGQKPSAMPYWNLPDSALDDPEEASDLARRALAYL